MEKIFGAEEERWSHQVRPKARGLVQHGGPPGWLAERDPAGCDFDRDGRSIPPALTTPLAAVLGYLLPNVHKTPS